MVDSIGCYNMDNCGEVWEDGKCYIMVIFSKFVLDKEISRKKLYFLVQNGNKLHAVPDFEGEKEITAFLKGKKENEICVA